MTKIQISKHGFKKLEFRISNLFRISIFEFRILTQRGVSLYLALMIMTMLLAIAFGLSAIFLGQTKMLRTMGHSVLAFYAADAGIEEVLMQRTNPSSVCTEISPCSLTNGAQYYLVIRTPGPDCAADNYCITSVGIYQETRRAIEITY